jgi:hypothetical protein
VFILAMKLNWTAILVGMSVTATAGVLSAAPAPSTYATSHFRVVHALGEERVSEMGTLLETLYSRYLAIGRAAGFALRDPDRPLDWFYGWEPDYPGGLLRDESSDERFDEESFYCSRRDCVVLPAQVGGSRTDAGDAAAGRLRARRLSHEIAHQLAFRTGLQTRGVMYAFWLSEGLAMNFETPDPRSGEFASDNPVRCCRLLDAHQEGRLVPLESFLLRASPPRDEAARNDSYAQAWGVVRFLYQQHPESLRRYVSALAVRPHGQRPEAALRREFTQAFGPVALVQAEWDAYLKGLSDAEKLAGGS